MLVIFDDQNRTAGVKEYLIDGEKVTSSNYTKYTGLSKYLNEGRNGDRDIKDMRIPIHGDLDVLDEVIKMGTAKGASESYRNIVLSFEEDNISKKHLNEIVNSFLSTYMVGYEKDEYTAYSEAHKPKIKYKIDENGNKVKRHLHVHLSIAKYSVKHDRLLDMGHNGEFVKTGGRLKEVEHWKKLIEQRYELKPTDTKPISTGNTYKNKTLQQIREGLISFCENQSQSLDTLDQLINELKQFDFIESIKRSKNARTPYISIKLDNGKSIRLKGTLFKNESFNLAKEKLLNKTNNHLYSESKEPIEVQVPKEFTKLQEARASKVTKDMAKVRAKHQDILSDLKPLEMNDSYKGLVRKLEYKSEMVSPLTYRAKNIKAKQKHKINLSAYNKKLDARVLLQLLQESHNINEEIYHAFINTNGEYRIQLGTHHYNISDFLLNQMHFDWEETVKTLSYVYKEQQKLQKSNNFVATPSTNIYESMSYQNKVFIDIYNSHTNLDLSSFYITQTNEVTILKKGGVSIEDRGETLQSKPNLETKKQVEIMLSLVKAKEWDLDDIEIEGSERFKREVHEQIRSLKKVQEQQNTTSKKRRQDESRRSSKKIR